MPKTVTAPQRDGDERKYEAEAQQANASGSAIDISLGLACSNGISTPN